MHYIVTLFMMMIDDDKPEGHEPYQWCPMGRQWRP